MRLVVAAAVVDDTGPEPLVLAARRSRPPELAGRWEFPGGKVEPGELPVEALVRELWEELEVRIEVGAELRPPPERVQHPDQPPLDPLSGQQECWPISSSYELRVWEARLVAGVPRAGESHDALLWLPPAALAEPDWLPADRLVALELQRLVRDAGAPWLG